MTDTHDAAVALLAPIWRGIPADYKTKYSYTIWDQFQHQVQSAAYTSSLPKFLHRICSRLSVSLAEIGLPDVAGVCASGHDRAILRIYREEAAYVVTLLRLAHEERKATARI